MQNPNILERIRGLKKERNAVLLAHLYQLPEIQDIADFVGDSLDLSRKARETQADVIVFCGVRFMAETAKILNPGKTVLLPRKNAGCPMADTITPEDIARLKQRHPGAAVVCYVNSSAGTKALSDICCTSSNAVKITASLKEKEIIFVPDKNLGQYVARFLPEKHVILWDGSCPVHDSVSVADVQKAQAAFPGAPVLAHPECRPEVLALADFTGSTSQIIDYAVQSEQQAFIILTESGVLHRLRQVCPGKQFYMLHPAMVCPDMKVTTLSDVYDALYEMQYPVELDKRVIGQAAVCLDRMLAV